jgi:hypothetical protein
MTSPEAARHDLYTVLIEVLGPERAETLMAVLPAYDISQLVTKEEFRAGLAELRAEFKCDLQQGLASVNQRIDRLFLAWLAGQAVTLAAIIGLAFLH